jgi:hypothetical protein
MINSQTTLFVVSMVNAIGWVLALAFFILWLAKCGKYQILTADHKALKESYDKISIELKNRINPIIDSFNDRPSRPGGSKHAQY